METEELRRRIMEVLEYDHETGLFRRTVLNKFHLRASQEWQNGTRVGYARKRYRAIRVLGSDYQCHRLAWLISYSEWPSEQIDHINGNRIENLRCVSPAENNMNTRMASNNTTGFPGVFRCTGSKNFRAMIRVKGKLIHLGCYESPEKAYAVRVEANRTHGFHENHGIR